MNHIFNNLWRKLNKMKRDIKNDKLILMKK